MFALSPLLREVPDWDASSDEESLSSLDGYESPRHRRAKLQSQARRAAKQPKHACVVCGVATVWPDSSYCFTHWVPEPPKQLEQPEAQRKPTECAQEPRGAPEEPEAVREACVSRQYANRLHRELELGTTTQGGRLLTEQDVRSHLEKLRRRAQGLSERYRAAELSRIEAAEQRWGM